MTEQRNTTPDASERAKAGLKRVEGGDTTGAGLLEQAQAADPAATEAAEQEAADGPGARGLAR